MQKPILISFEGNIGAGKTTLLAKMRSQYKYRADIFFLDEPVDLWEQVKHDGKTILECFYADQKQYAFAFQVLAFQTRLKMIKEACANPEIKIIVMERSLEADFHIFVKMLFREGFLQTYEYEIYDIMSQLDREKYAIDRIVWIQTDPVTCLQRILKRAREGENQITLSYLEDCHKHHVAWLLNNPKVHKDDVDDLFE